MSKTVVSLAEKLEEDDFALTPEEDNESTAQNRDSELPLTAVLGALFFASPRPLSVQSLADAAKRSPEEIETALERMKDTFREDVLGFSLLETGGLWQLRTASAAARVVQRLIPPKAKRLSRAAAETLAVIAYKQPVQRAEIEAIRGVDALATLKTLLEARLIRIVGRAESPGQPALYGTTQTFLEKFGLRDLSELPTIRELEQLAKDPGEPDDGLEENVDCGGEGEQAPGSAAEQ